MTLDYQTPPGHFPSLPEPRAVITPLRLIFWGSLLLIFDLSISSTTNGEGFKFDFLDDTLGMILISVGVFRLARIPVPGNYRSIMTFIKIVCLLNILSTIDGHFIYRSPEPLSFLRLLFGLVKLVAIILFCTAMRTLALYAAFTAVARSWHITRLLFILIYLLPLGLFYCAGLVAIATGKSLNFNLGPAGLLLLLVFVIPVIHFFISTSRFKRALEAHIPAMLPSP